MIKQLAITSFHRSGSSLTAQYLHNAGLNMGRKLIGAMPSNPYGHYEDIEVVQINDDLLNYQGGAWFNDHAIYSAFEHKLLIRIQNYLSYRAITHSQFALKDPRLCITARSWLTASNSLKFLFIHRGALRSCKSLWRRAYDDYRAGEATSFNKRLIADKSSIYNLYLNNVGNFISTAKSLQNWKDRIIFISYDDLGF